MSTKKGARVLALVGGQFGSEGKGVIAHHLALRFQVHVRTGGPNAGHSFYDQGVVGLRGGRLWKMRSIPCGWVNPEAALVIGPGAVVDMKVLSEEIKLLEAVGVDVRHRLMVDADAAVITDDHRNAEVALRKQQGSTASGVGATRISRLARGSTALSALPHYRVADVAREFGLGDVVMAGTPSIIDHFMRRGRDVLLEGTQGFGLSLTHGQWPWVTGHDTTAAQLAADAGVPPQRITDVLVVVRTMAIRVAGRSGPMSGETSWPDLSRRLGREVQERTTVTQEVRRIGNMDLELVQRALRVNGATGMALMFVDYLDSRNLGVTEERRLLSLTREYIDRLEVEFGVNIRLIGTGRKSDDEPFSVIERYGQF